jgi:autotransporter-associated beta strand protein
MLYSAGSSFTRYTPPAIRLAVCLLLILSVLAATEPALAVTIHSYGPFDVSFYNSGESYTDTSNNVYTGTKNWTATEMDDVAAMIQVWDNGIANPAGPRQIRLNLMWTSMGGALGNSLNYFTGNNTTAYSNAEYIWREGSIPDSSGADSFIRFDSTTSWNTGAGAPSSNTWDFRSVMAHELGHSLGFGSLYDSATDTFWNGGLTEYEKHLRDAATGGDQPNVGGTGTPGNFNQTASPVYFDGTNANAANGGSRVAIYAPSPFAPSSSLTHLNESTYPNALMSPYMVYGQMVRQPTTLEWQMMKDLGWSIIDLTKTWSNGGGDSQWGTNTNWSPNGIPDASQDTYFTNTGLTANGTVTLGADRSINSLIFDTTTNFTIGGAAGALTITSGNISRTSTSSGTQTIARPIVLGANGIWNIAGSGQLTVSGAISGSHSLEKTGTGALYLSGANTYNGATTLTNGTLYFSGGSTASTAFNVASATTLNFSGGTHNISSAAFTNLGTININGATLSANSSTTIPGTVNFSSGGINGTSTLTFSNQISWTGGTMSGSGTTILQAGMNVSSGSTLLLDGRTLNNAGTITFSSNDLQGKNGAIFNNQLGTTINIQGYNNFVNVLVGATPALNNAGTFRKSTAPSIMDFGFAMNNTGTVDVQKGQLDLLGGGTSTGLFSVSSGAVLDFSSGNYNLGGSTYSNSGIINISGATVSFNAPTNINGTVNFSSGTLNGSSIVTFSGPLTWTAGTMSGSGSTNIQNNATLSGNGDPMLDARTLTNTSTVTFINANYLHGKNGAAFINQSGALVNLQGTNSFINEGVGAIPVINNIGTFRKSTSTSIIDIGFAMNNSGTVDLQTGSMYLSGGGTSTGTFNVATGTIFAFTGGTHNLGGSTFNNAGKIYISGATVAFNAPTTMPGTVNFNTGTLSGANTVTLTGPLTWIGGTMSGSGSTLAQGGIVFDGTGDTFLDGRTLTNTATATFLSTNYLYGRNGAIFNNQAGALLDLQGLNYFVHDAGVSPTLNNAGTFQKSVSTSIINFGFTLNNTGNLDVQKGTLNLNGPVTQISGNTLNGGAWIVRASSTLSLPTGTDITVNKGNITLEGLGSSFTSINNLADNQGDFSILAGRNFTTVSNLANSGDLTVGSGSNFSVTGDLSGTGNTIVNGLLTADSIVQNTLTIGSGANVTIRPITGAPLSLDSLHSVPEPSTFLMLFIAASLLAFAKLFARQTLS